MGEQRRPDGAQEVSVPATATGLPGLRAVREAKLLTQQELAKASGVSRLTISELEGGVRSARLQTIRRLAVALEVPAQELLQTAQPLRHPRWRRGVRSEPATQSG